MCGKNIRPEEINIPSLVIVPTLDHIVPRTSSLPLAEKLPDPNCLKIKAGHIGMVAGSRAKASLYDPLAEWLESTIP